MVTVGIHAYRKKHKKSGKKSGFRAKADPTANKIKEHNACMKKKESEKCRPRHEIPVINVTPRHKTINETRPE